MLLYTSNNKEEANMRHIVGLVMLAAYIVGIVLAKGFWSTFFAVVIPFWSYYLVAERFVEKFLM